MPRVELAMNRFPSWLLLAVPLIGVSQAGAQKPVSPPVSSLAAPAEFGAIDLELSALSPPLRTFLREKSTLSALRRTDSPLLKFRAGAPGFYRLQVSARGDKRAGRIEVEATIRVGEGKNALVVRGSGAESWPLTAHPLTARPTPIPTEEVRPYPRFESKVRRYDKRGRRLFPSIREQWEYDQTHNDHGGKKPKTPGSEARVAFDTAVENARGEAESKLQSALLALRAPSGAR